MTFELGVNYWPRQSAMYMWREFDIAPVRDDMANIADIGFDVVRVFALTQDFLPAAMTVAHDMVARLEEVCLAAKDAGLTVVPTLMAINMSGRMWWPDWMLDDHGRSASLFSDPALLRSQALLVETCARALSGDNAIRAFDLANEIDDAQRPDSRDAGWLWASLLANAVRRVAHGTAIQIGAHLPSLTTANNMRVDDLAAIADEDVMHAYPLYCDAAQSFLDPYLVPFACLLTRALAGSGRPTLMQEFGLCTAPPGAPGQTITDDFLGQPRSQYLASEAEAAAYFEAVLNELVTTGAAGAYAWCYADYDSRLFDRPPFDTALRERTFGLVRADGSEKPATNIFREFRKRRDAGSLASGSPAGFPEVTADEYYRAPARNFARLYADWLARGKS
ncbi:MAG: cellulase family glycosylhydrolase [Gemmatimonadaceae bacterium]|nr:cellulase family glycosylhydrolase [Gemmatimonadaceae bacterium]